MKAILEKYGVTEYRLAKDTGISQTSISNYTRGRSKAIHMKLEMAKTIADYLGITLDDFYDQCKAAE